MGSISIMEIFAKIVTLLGLLAVTVLGTPTDWRRVVVALENIPPQSTLESEKRITVGENEVIYFYGKNDFYDQGTFPDSSYWTEFWEVVMSVEGFDEIPVFRNSEQGMIHPRGIRGPAEITVRQSLENRSEETIPYFGSIHFYVIDTFENTANVDGTPSTSVVIPSNATGPVQVILECSSDLVNWTACSPGSYNPQEQNRFFRVRALTQN